MTSYRGFAALAATVAAVCLASSASAVTYVFGGQGAKTFAYDRMGFVGDYTRLTPSALTRSSGNFDTVEFCFAGNQCGRRSDGTSYNFVAATNTIYIISSFEIPVSELPPGATDPIAASVGQTFEFARGTFARVGRHDALASAGPGTLSVDDGTLAEAVPEPSTWAMMLAGFGLVGAASRRRRARGAATHA